MCDQAHGGANLPCTAVSRRLLALLAVAAAAVVVVLVARGGGSPPGALVPGGGTGGDPLAWSPERSDDYADRAAKGLAHVLYAKSPGGLPASVERTKSWRPMIDAVAKQADADPDTLEAIVLLESAGRPEAMASSSFRGAVGLTQILAETGQNLLGMRVDPVASRRLTRRIARAHGRHAQRLRAARRRVDERFDPRKAVAATARYLAIARARLGRDDLAIASYHMGIGNLQTALRRYGATVPYAQLYFDSTPLRHASAYRFLAGLGDDSSTYLWRIDAAREALRADAGDLGEQARLQTARNSAEEVLHPPGETRSFGDPGALGDAYDDGDVVHLPAAWLRARGVAIDGGMGSLAGTVGEKPALYRGLRREALATLAYVGAQVRAISGARAPLHLTSTVRDAKYQRHLAAVDIEAVDDYSLHTTGFAFDIARDYASRAQALAFQFALDRLTALNLVAWVREPTAIHVTVATDAARLERATGVAAGG
jgi:hypothetical protein